MNERCHDRFPREGITNERVKEIEKTGECNIKPPQPNETLGGGAGEYNVTDSQTTRSARPVWNGEMDMAEERLEKHQDTKAFR